MSEPITMSGEYQTRDGRPVRVLCVDLKNWKHPVLAARTTSDGREALEVYQSDGRLLDDGCEHHLDLIPRPRTHEVKVKLWLCRDEGGGHYPTTLGGYAPIAAKEITVTFTEGEGL